MKGLLGYRFWIWFAGLAVAGIAAMHLYFAFDAGEIQNRVVGNVSSGLLSIYITPFISFFSWTGLAGKALFYVTIVFSALVYAFIIRLMGRILNWIQKRI